MVHWMTGAVGRAAVAQRCDGVSVSRYIFIIIIIRALALQRNMWSSRLSSLSSSDTHKLRNAKIVSQSALKTPQWDVYNSNYSNP